MSADDLGALGFAAEEFIHLGDGAIEDGDGEAVIIHVENEVLAHDGQTDESDVCLSFHEYATLIKTAENIPKAGARARSIFGVGQRREEATGPSRWRDSCRARGGHEA